jgi:hypothetical protein
LELEEHAAEFDGAPGWVSQSWLSHAEVSDEEAAELPELTVNEGPYLALRNRILGTWFANVHAELRWAAVEEVLRVLLIIASSHPPTAHIRR